jgi:hypothetical protein
MKSPVHAITKYNGKCCACTSETIMWPNLPPFQTEKKADLTV